MSSCFLPEEDGKGYPTARQEVTCLSVVFTKSRSWEKVEKKKVLAAPTVQTDRLTWLDSYLTCFGYSIVSGSLSGPLIVMLIIITEAWWHTDSFWHVRLHANGTRG